MYIYNEREREREREREKEGEVVRVINVRLLNDFKIYADNMLNIAVYRFRILYIFK
jgi:hypothetical protein